jgi:hypothetical protein
VAELTATIKVRGTAKDGLDPHRLGDLLNDAINREARVLQAGGFTVLGVESTVPETANLDPATGIEDPRRMCEHCGRFLGYTHSPECDRQGQVELKDTVAN